MKKNVLFINGVPDNGSVVVQEIEKNGTVKWVSSGGMNISDYVKSDLFRISSLLLDTTEVQDFPPIKLSAVFNQISDIDTHKITLKKIDDVYKAIGDQVPFFNLPSLMINTSRDNIYRALQGIDKLHVPKTVKIQPKSPLDIYNTMKEEGFEFPVILRSIGDYSGIGTIKIDTDKEELNMCALDGRDYYLTQFVEYSEEDKLYKKYRLMVVDGKVYLRHVQVSTNWMVHDKNQIKNPQKLQQVSAKRFLNNKETIQKIVTDIYNQLQLDYFGIDCYIDKNMDILVFEVNPNMGALFYVKGEIFNDNVDKIREAVTNMIDSQIM
jgi:glutathione synthase/RimK-type ligase-like ATP-grasp enzyme